MVHKVHLMMYLIDNGNTQNEYTISFDLTHEGPDG